MKVAVTFALGAVLGFAAAFLPNFIQRAQAASRQALLHTHRQFDFIAKAPVNVTGPLFGAERERAWAPDWNPQFVWPAQANDQEGMVFTLAHGGRNAIWVNTSFDLGANRVQYVYVVPDTLVTVIELKLTPNGDTTHVAVTYDRTALTGKANHLVREMAERDAHAGPEWARQINGYLGKG